MNCKRCESLLVKQKKESNCNCPYHDFICENGHMFHSLDEHDFKEGFADHKNNIDFWTTFFIVATVCIIALKILKVF